MGRKDKTFRALERFTRKNINLKDKDAARMAQEIFENIRQERRTTEAEEQLLLQVRDHMQVMWPKLVKLMQVANFIVKAEGPIEAYKKSLKEGTDRLGKRLQNIQQGLNKMRDVAKKIQHAEEDCLRLAQEVATQDMPQLNTYIRQLERMGGVGLVIARKIFQEVDKFNTDIDLINNVWKVSIKLET